MKFKKKGLTNFRQTQPPIDKVIISSEQYEAPEVTTFICNYCNRDLIKLSDSSGNNATYYCSNCSVPYEPENESIRHKQKLSVPDRNIEPAVATTPGIPDISIHHEPELKGAFKVLQQKGLKIRDYKEDVG
jgi:hypothetical protein